MFTPPGTHTSSVYSAVCHIYPLRYLICRQHTMFSDGMLTCPVCTSIPSLSLYLVPQFPQMVNLSSPAPFTISLHGNLPLCPEMVNLCFPAGTMHHFLIWQLILYPQMASLSIPAGTTIIMTNKCPQMANSSFPAGSVTPSISLYLVPHPVALSSMPRPS